MKKRTDMPMVGVGVFIKKDGKYLLGKRMGSHGAGEYSLPGGHLEHMETLEDCAANEVFEETGLQISNPRVLTAIEAMFPEEDLHYVTVFVVADYHSGELENREPEKCEGWDWYTPEEFPVPLFGGIKKARELL